MDLITPFNIAICVIIFLVVGEIRRNLPVFILADNFFEILSRSSIVLFDGSTGRYKTLCMVALSEEIYKRNKKHKHILANMPLYSPYAASGAIEYGKDGVQQVSNDQKKHFEKHFFSDDHYRDSIVLVDEASLFNELHTDFEINTMLKNARKENQCFIMAGVGNASSIRKYCKLFVSQSKGGNLQRFGLPIIKFNFHEIADRDKRGKAQSFYLILPTRFFSLYATRFAPDFNISPIDQWNDREALYNWRSMRLPKKLYPFYYIDSWMLAKRNEKKIKEANEEQKKAINYYDASYDIVERKLKDLPKLEFKKKGIFDKQRYLADFDPLWLAKSLLISWFMLAFPLYVIRGGLGVDSANIIDAPVNTMVDSLLFESPQTSANRCAWCKDGTYMKGYILFGYRLEDYLND